MSELQLSFHRDAKFGGGWCDVDRGWSVVGASQRRMELEKSGGG